MLKEVKGSIQLKNMEIQVLLPSLFLYAQSYKIKKK